MGLFPSSGKMMGTYTLGAVYHPQWHHNRMASSGISFLEDLKKILFTG
jgi:hypothetical protein